MAQFPQLLQDFYIASKELPGKTVDISLGIRIVDGKARIRIGYCFILGGKQEIRERFLDKDDLQEIGSKGCKLDRAIIHYLKPYFE